MLAKMVSGIFDRASGRVQVILATSTQPGYPNSCEQFGPYGWMAVPLPGQMVEISPQSMAQVQATGYNNQVTDPNFSLLPGESSSYNASWYGLHALSGEYLQEAGTTNAENLMMGQSTNAVLTDILNYLVDLESYIGSHVHSGCGGIDNSGAPVDLPPAPTDLATDATYIAANKNLAITDTYEPKVTLTAIFNKLKGIV